MTLNDGFDRTVSDWLDVQAGRGAPDYLDETLARTTRTRQRPWWASPERWLPVQTTLRLAPAPRVAWLLAVLALVIALGAAVLVIGSRHRTPAPSLGLARNGVILYGGTDKDIHSLDPVTGTTATLITGPAGDHLPLLSPDGTRLLFLRDSDIRAQGVGPLEPMIMVANDDGSDVRALTGALANFGSFNGNTAWSHDGSKVAVSSGGDLAPRLEISLARRFDEACGPRYRGDGGGVYRLPAGRRGGHVPRHDEPGRRPLCDRNRWPRAPDDPGDDHWRRRDPVAGWDEAGLPGLRRHEGRHPCRRRRHQRRSGPGSRSAGGRRTDRRLRRWSPDGTRLLFIRYRFGTENHLAVASVAGGRAVEIGPAMPTCRMRVPCGVLPGRYRGARALRRRRFHLAARPDRGRPASSFQRASPRRPPGSAWRPVLAPCPPFRGRLAIRRAGLRRARSSAI